MHPVVFLYCLLNPSITQHKRICIITVSKVGLFVKAETKEQSKQWMHTFSKQAKKV
jgi:hypothetical protein